MDTTPKLSPEACEGYKRVHFFKHFLTEEDWNARHLYHCKKSQLHNFYFHGVGIQDGDTSLRVLQHGQGCLKVEITPGIALDSEGHEIFIQSPVIETIELEKFGLPTTIYIKIVYQDIVSDRVRLPDGRIENKYFREAHRIIISQKPAGENQLELARVALSGQCVAVKNAVIPELPGLDEIDMTMRRHLASIVNLDMLVRSRLLAILAERKKAYDRIGGNAKLGAMAGLGLSFQIMTLLINSNTIREHSLADMLNFFRVFDEHAIILIMGKVEARILERPEWQKHVDNCRAFRQLLDDPSKTLKQKLSMLLILLEKTSFSYAHLERIIGNERRVYVYGQKKPMPRAYPITSNWDFVKVWSSEMPEVFDIDDLEWLRHGELNITDEASEKKYKFRILESHDAWINRQRLYFPDGALVEDTGVAHEGGYHEFVVSNVIPDTHFAIIRMMDYARGDFELMINVNGRDVGISRCDGYDRNARWRNWPYVIPAYYVNDTVLRIRQTLLTADRDVNMFRFWFYQPMNF